MTTIHVQRLGDKALLSQEELNQLLSLARQHEDIKVQLDEDDLPITALMRFAEQGKAFDFWHDEAENIYTLDDGEAI
jgi:hypothetical protein